MRTNKIAALKVFFLAMAGWLQTNAQITQPIMQNVTAPIQPALNINACIAVSGLSHLTAPFAPGQREITFRLPLTEATSKIEVIVYYSKSASSFGMEVPSRTLNHGKAVIQRIGKPGYAFCRFIFPHTNFRSASNGPNKRLYNALREKATPDILNTASDTLSMDSLPLLIKKGECVYYKIVKNETVNGVLRTSCSGTLQFTMPDIFSIGIAGDSYASGEGAPNNPFTGIVQVSPADGIWNDCLCHRSIKSGLVRGCKLFKHTNPHVAVNFIHRACSGAVISNLYNCRKEKSTDNTRICSTRGTTCTTGEIHTRPAQFKAIQDEVFINSDQVNMVLMGAGGNNSLFGAFVVQYLLLPFNASGPLESPFVNELINESNSNMNDMIELYKYVNHYLEREMNKGRANFIKPIPAIQTYPNSTQRTGESCGCTEGALHIPVIAAAMAGACAKEFITYQFLPPPLGTFVSAAACVTNAAATAVTVSQGLHAANYGGLAYENSCMWSPREEWLLLQEKFLTPLNNKIRSYASELKWSVIDVENVMINNGLCNRDNPWKNGIGATLANQGDIWGVVHPNSKGYEAYIPRVLSLIEKKYEEYILTYALCLLNNCVSFRTDGCAPSANEQISIAITTLYNNLNKLSAYDQLKPADLVLKSISPIVMDSALLFSRRNSITSTSAYTGMANASVKLTVCFSEMSKSIIHKKEATAMPPMPPSEPIGPAQAKLITATTNYMSTEEFQKVRINICDDYNKNKLNDPSKRNSNYVYFLDGRYNENFSQ